MTADRRAAKVRWHDIPQPGYQSPAYEPFRRQTHPVLDVLAYAVTLGMGAALAWLAFVLLA